MAERVVLAYSGGLDTSAIVPWLVETHGCEVIAFVADVGQGDDELAGVEKKAKNSGAVDCRVVDLKRAFVEEFVYPTMAAGAVYEGRYLLGTSMARPIIARAQAAMAREVGATAVAHGCTGKGNDQVRFEATFSALAPELKVIAPWREWAMRSREELIAYCKSKNVPVTSTAEKIYSRDRNLWHISHEGGAIENPWNEPPADAWMLTADPREAPDAPVDVSLTFEHGRPVAVNGEAMAGDELVLRLNAIAGPHGVGRVDLVENRCVGMKSRGLYETPGGAVIVEGLAGLEELTLDREAAQLRREIGLKFARLVYDGRWFTPTRVALQAAADSIMSRVSGEVVVRLYKGTATAIKRKSAMSLYAEDYATFGEDTVYDQKHAEGFIRLFTLPERIAGAKGIGTESLPTPAGGRA
ncbi:MAG: argininosuccinate synthase [Phycisphaerales bacterium]|nr:MAG: argininosuccinate synthase [Phycisphaerales bacterium]